MSNDDKQQSEPDQGRRTYLKGLGAAGALLWGSSGTVGATKTDDKNKLMHRSEIEVDRDDIHYMSVSTLAGLIRDEILSPVEVVDAFLERIKNIDDEVNAFITLTEDLARKQARAKEKAIKQGDDLGPLHGVPFAVKDLQPVKGIRYTSGALPLKDRMAEETATYVQRYMDAGAV